MLSALPRRYLTACTASALVGLYGLSGCAMSPKNSAMSPQALESAGDRSADSSAAPEQAAANALQAGSNVPAARPQLIKRAYLTLTVTSVDDSLTAVTQILNTQQADILDLQDQQPSAGDRRQAYLRLRVPEANLEATLKALSGLGTVQQQSISAEDVSNQLVDLQARLRNLRKSESALLKLMERSGSIADVLEVSRELSRVREQIEQLDAQEQSLQTQVSYATVELTLAAAVATPTTPRPLGERATATWQTASHSVGEFTVGLMQLGLWLLAYSPYLAVAALAAVLGYRQLRRAPR
jgi:hypothetical protein